MPSIKHLCKVVDALGWMIQCPLNSYNSPLVSGIDTSSHVPAIPAGTSMVLSASVAGCYSTDVIMTSQAPISTVGHCHGTHKRTASNVDLIVQEEELSLQEQMIKNKERSLASEGPRKDLQSGNLPR